MMAAPFLGPIAGPIAAAAGSGKEHGGIDYDILALTMASTLPCAAGPQQGQMGVTSVQNPGVMSTTPWGAQSLTPATTGYAAPWYAPTSLRQGISNVRDMTLGDPSSRQLLDWEGFNVAGQGMGNANPFTWNPGSNWTNTFGSQQGIFSPNADWDAIKSSGTNIVKPATAQAGVMAQTEIMEDYEKQKERDEAENRGFWRNYFAGMTRNRPYEEGQMGAEIDELYAQYGAADEYDPYYGMRDAYAGTYFDEDRWYGKKGGRTGYALGGNDEVGGLSSLTSQVPKNVPGVPNGMQIDARKPGGTYIDAGTKPKADDVAAMLSEGEFVITKDGMEGFDLQTGGPGDSRSGAKKMYTQMNEWETVAAQAGV